MFLLLAAGNTCFSLYDWFIEVLDYFPFHEPVCGWFFNLNIYSLTSQGKRILIFSDVSVIGLPVILVAAQ
jgi:hypothetical protein